MTGSAAVDSNVYIALRSGDRSAAAVLGSLETVCLPVVVLGELLYGADNSSRQQANRVLVEDFAALCVTLEVSAAVARCYARLRSGLRRQGRPIPENDLWIAATCIEAGVPLITRDGHFAAVPGLRTVVW